MVSARHEFASDNTAGICPEARAALAEANAGHTESYGEDYWSERLRDRVRQFFDGDCEAFLVFNGTAANALSLAQLVKPFHSIICHEYAHIYTDECGACEFSSGGSKLIPLPGDRGKLKPPQIEAALGKPLQVHSHTPRVVSVTQATELGTVYAPSELYAISTCTRRYDAYVHMDGARFANALAALRCPAKEITWQSGVDVLCFGGTKNGLAAGELVVFFNRGLSEQFAYRAKQAGQLASKTRFFAAPWLALLHNEIWLKNALHANAAAARLAESLREYGVEIVFPVEANSVFVRANQPTVCYLRDRGWRFYNFIEPDVYRLMCSWSTTPQAISELASDFRDARSCASPMC